MEKTLKFNSQIATSRVQSERLLSLGLKKETADMCWSNVLMNGNREWLLIPTSNTKTYTEMEIPAWSLHRLIEMMDIDFQTRGRYVILSENAFIESTNIYDNICDCIEWLIKEGYFNKEYLENGNC